ncbi:WD repeat-containing protein on Y chromosome-like [Lineus longissimus]|uniref:WD repeat-containing protein on Y chromosome-like n=1 Tax=Lineus longissimus TaxID=88925 RepID=UPI00315DEBCA
MTSENPWKVRPQSEKRTGRRSSGNNLCLPTYQTMSTVQDVMQKLRRQSDPKDEFLDLDSLELKGSNGSHSRTEEECVLEAASLVSSLGREVNNTSVIRIASVPLVRSIVCDDESDEEDLEIDSTCTSKSDDSDIYEQLAKRFFRRSPYLSSSVSPGLRRSKATNSEKLLLETIKRHDRPQAPRLHRPLMMPAGARDIPKPTKKKIRPSSAAAKLQSHPKFYTTTLYDVGRPTTAVLSTGGLPSEKANLSQRPVTHAGPRGFPKVQETTRQRRNTLSTVAGIADTETAVRGIAPPIPTGTVLKSKIEEKINIETLEELKGAFEQAQYGSLNLDEFKDLLRLKLHVTGGKIAQIDALFQKIDWSSEGQITWDEFCTYMQLEYAEKEDSYLRAKEVLFHLPAKIEQIPHREPVLRITDTSDGHFIACSKDGMVSFWSSLLDIKRTRTVVTAEMSARQKQKWITDFVIMNQYNKFIVGTGDREIQFFELSSFEPYCQISGLETVPLKLDYCSTGYDECMILYGDSTGCVNILVIHSAGECLRTWKKMPKQDGIANVGIEHVANSSVCKFIRWKVHDDWVQELKYYDNIRQVISCSNHASTALVIGSTVGSTHVEQQLKEIKDPSSNHEKAKTNKLNYSYTQMRHRLDADQTVFKIYKGVKTFDFSKSKNVIVTGGMDRILRIWNPYVCAKPTGTLRGHNAPICYLKIAEEENRVYSVSTDRCIKVWDISDHNILLTIRPKGHKIRGDLQACFYSNVAKGLAVATDTMALVSQRLRPTLHADIPITHKEPIHCCKYNPSFKQVITCSDGSAVKVWDFESGNAIFDYGDAHGDSAITCMTFDNTGRRLITGGRDGCLRIWNYNNGHCLRTMTKEHGNEEICSITYVELNKNRYVISVGWDKKINIYPDSLEGTIHHIQHPMPKWGDDQNGHKEDILSVAQCPPNLLATSSYDGEVIVWNLVSGHIFCHMVADVPEGYEDESLDGDLSINKLLFLMTRSSNKDVASLVASGPRGHVHFWNCYQGGCVRGRFLATQQIGGMITAMDVNKRNTVLYTADNFGFICVWNIGMYAMEHTENSPPELLFTWRGHIESVTCIDLVEEHKMMLTASLDCTVRMWTLDGEYVGTFGQPDPWDVFDSETFIHPMVPYDVLVDPMSLPSHPVLSDRVSDSRGGESEEPEEEKEKQEKPQALTPTFYGRSSFYVDDATIAEQIKEKPFNHGTGKRLRHEKNKPIRIDRGGPSEYQYLTCYELEDTPELEAPKLRANKNDPLNFDYFDD